MVLHCSGAAAHGAYLHGAQGILVPVEHHAYED